MFKLDFGRAFILGESSLINVIDNKVWRCLAYQCVFYECGFAHLYFGIGEHVQSKQTNKFFIKGESYFGSDLIGVD